MYTEGLYILETDDGKIIHTTRIENELRLRAKEFQNAFMPMYQVKIWWNSTRMALCFKKDEKDYLLKVEEGKLMLDNYNGERPKDNDENCWFERENVGADTHYSISTVHKTQHYFCISANEVCLTGEKTDVALVTHVPVPEAAQQTTT